VTNPLVNSYKRLVPGYEAPIYATWSQRDHSPLVRVPARRASGARIELRSPDPSCNPYLALAAIIWAGRYGLEQKMEPPRQTGSAVYHMSADERRDMGIVPLPENLEEALLAMETDEVVQRALGEHITARLTEAKRIEWDYYRRQVHKWELDQYLSAF
jgi:glutamine synthetase